MELNSDEFERLITLLVWSNINGATMSSEDREERDELLERLRNPNDVDGEYVQAGDVAVK